MSRSLTAAARKRYAPHSLFVLWGSVGSRTDAERFVEAVAGRWERSALALEEQLHARTPALSWSERPVARPFVRPAVRSSREPPALDQEEQLHPRAPAFYLSARPVVSRVDPEAEVTASSADRPHLERSEASRQARSVRASSPRSGSAARGRVERATGSAGRRPRSVTGRSVTGQSKGAFVAPPDDPEMDGEPGRSGSAADGGGVPRDITGSSEPPVLESSRRQRHRFEEVSPPEVDAAASADGASAESGTGTGTGTGTGLANRPLWRPAVSGRGARGAPVDVEKASDPEFGGAASARGGPAGRGDDIDASVWTPAVSSHLARPWNPVDDIDESARRRFEEWTLERRWRDEAREEWRRWEF